MIAAERNWWTSLSPKRGLTLYKADEIVRGMAERDEGRRDQAQRNSVSFNQSEVSIRREPPCCRGLIARSECSVRPLGRP